MNLSFLTHLLFGRANVLRAAQVKSLESMDRRSGFDRRQCVTHPFTILFSPGRRHQNGRRKNDASNIYVDCYTPVLRYICIGILLLSMIDAFFTLRLIDKGGSELNPLMAYLLSINIDSFVFVKFIMTAVSVFILVAHFHFRWLGVVKVSHILYCAFIFYVLLVNYEIMLLLHVYY